MDQNDTKKGDFRLPLNKYSYNLQIETWFLQTKDLQNKQINVLSTDRYDVRRVCRIFYVQPYEGHE